MAESKNQPQELAALLKSIVLGDALQSIESSVKKLDEKITSDLSSLKQQLSKELTQSIEALKKELADRVALCDSRIDKFEKTVSDDLAVAASQIAELKGVIDKRITQISEESTLKLNAADKAIRENMARFKADVDQHISMDKKESLESFKDIESQFASIREELKVRKSEAAKVSAFLAGFARTISADVTPEAESIEPPAPPTQRVYVAQSASQAPASASKKAPPAKVEPENDLPGADDLENNIDNMFNLSK